ncbi:MAG: hypothetical protein ABI882_18880 [Acidobacteriota bacterium]
MKCRSIFALFLVLMLCNSPSLGQRLGGDTSQTKNEPLTLQDINLLLRRSIGRDMTEGDLATRIDRIGIAFDPSPEVIGRLRANGAHPHLLNAVRRAGERLSANAGATITMTAGGPADALIEEVRRNVRDYIDELPDFICQQEVTRYYDNGTGAWDRRDMLVYELTYNRKQESYRPVNSVGRPVTRSLEDSGGAYSTGDFATSLAMLFAPETKTIFKPAGKEKLGQRQAVIYDFRVPLLTSKLSIKADNVAPIIAGYSGSVWIDSETKQVLRIEQAADDLPANFPVTQAETSVDYDMVRLRGLDVEFLLPTHAEFIIADRRRRQYSRNMIYFKFYRKFETDIKVIDEPATPPVKPPEGR